MKQRVFREAAELVTVVRIVCCAALDYKAEEREFFRELFAPTHKEWSRYNDRKNDLRENWFGDVHIEENQLARSLALLFCEQILESEA